MDERMKLYDKGFARGIHAGANVLEDTIKVFRTVAEEAETSSMDRSRLLTTALTLEQFNVVGNIRSLIAEE